MAAKPAPATGTTEPDPAREWRRSDYFALSGVVVLVFAVLATAATLAGGNGSSFVSELIVLPSPVNQLGLPFLAAASFVGARVITRFRLRRRLRFTESIGFGFLISFIITLGVAGTQTFVPRSSTGGASATSSSPGPSTSANPGSRGGSPTPLPSGSSSKSAVALDTNALLASIGISELLGFVVTPLLFPFIARFFRNTSRRREPPAKPAARGGRR